LIKTGMDNGVSPVTLSGVLLTPDGDMAGEGPIPVATFAASKGRVSLNRPADGQATAVFTEQKQAGQTRIYAQNFTTALLANKTFGSVSGIKVYPNPTNGFFTVNSSTQLESVNVYNLSGQLIVCEKVGTTEANINTESWSNGIYLIDIQTEEGKKTTIKLVKTN